MDFLKRVKSASSIERLQERARQDDGPRGYVDLCHALVVQGHPGKALSAARDGVRRFPRSLELADQLRLLWGKSGREDLLQLEREARATLSAHALRALAEHYSDVEELDPALDIAQRFFAHHPEDAAAPLLIGRILWKRFVRDHVAYDGMRAIESLQRAVAMDPRCLEAYCVLADANYYIGAVSKAREAAASALAIEPTNHDMASLHAALLPLAPEEATEDELLRAVEQNDTPWAGFMPQVARGQAPEVSAKARVSRMLHQISLMAGVRRLAFACDGIEISARDGHVFDTPRTPPDPMSVLTTMFRQRIASSAKHLGIGAFQEAEINLEKAVVLAFGAMAAVLLVEVQPGVRPSGVVAAGRDLMGAVDRAHGGLRHA